MKELPDKLRIIYKPFIVIAIGFIFIYTILNWLLFIQAGISLKEDVIQFWLPFTLPWIPVLVWLRPRIKLLNFKNDNASFGFQFLATLAIAIPTIIAQGYLVTATGKLTTLDNISAFENSKQTRYYNLKNYYIDKQHIGIQNTATVTGKGNQDFNMFIYVAMPLLTSIADTSNPEPAYWVGKSYSEQISNRLSEQEKRDRYKIFADKSQKDFDTASFDKFSYLELIGNTEKHDEYINAIKNYNARAANHNIVFEARNEAFGARNGNKLPWTMASFGIGIIAWMLLLVFPKFNQKRLEQFKAGKTIRDTDLKEMFDFFIPKEGFFTTPILINLNLLVYLLMVLAGYGFLSFKSLDLLNWGANYKPLTANGQWWRLLTSTFLHGGLMHILANLYGLLFVGIFLEPVLGRWKFLFVYLATGILASIASIWWYDATISVGASGAIFGLYGFFLACLLMKVFSPGMQKAFLVSTIVFVGFNLLMGFTGGIDNAAHIGGLISGFILGLVMSNQLKQKESSIDEYAVQQEYEKQEMV
jgi:rhomboid protease GluP